MASCAYFSNQVSSNQKLAISSTEINKVNVDYASDSWGTISIPDASVIKSGNEYVITGTGTSVMGMQGNGSKEYVCNLSGKIINGTVDFTFTCPAVMGGLNIAFMQGEIPAETVVPEHTQAIPKQTAHIFRTCMPIIKKSRLLLTATILIK